MYVAIDNDNIFYQTMSVQLRPLNSCEEHHWIWKAAGMLREVRGVASP